MGLRVGYDIDRDRGGGAPDVGDRGVPDPDRKERRKKPNKKPRISPTLSQADKKNKRARIIADNLISESVGYKPKISDEVKRLIIKRELSLQAQLDLQAIKKDLMSDTWWHISDASELTGIISSVISMHCDLILDLLEVPPSGKFAKLVIDLTLNIFRKNMNKGEFDIDLVYTILKETALKEKWDVGKSLIDIVLTFKKYGESLEKLTNISKERDSLKTQVRRQLIKIESELYRYKIQIKKADKLLNQKDLLINEINGTIDYFKKVDFNLETPYSGLNKNSTIEYI